MGPQHRGCQFDSSMSLYKNALVRKATGNHIVKSTSLEKPQSPVSIFHAANEEMGCVVTFMTFLTPTFCYVNLLSSFVSYCIIVFPSHFLNVNFGLLLNMERS